MGKNEKVKLDREHVERLLERVEINKGIAEKFVKRGFAEEWLAKNIELIGIYEDVLVDKVEEEIEKEEIDFYNKVAREEFDLYRKYYFGEEYRFVRRRIQEEEGRGKMD